MLCYVMLCCTCVIPVKCQERREVHAREVQQFAIWCALTLTLTLTLTIPAGAGTP